MTRFGLVISILSVLVVGCGGESKRCPASLPDGLWAECVSDGGCAAPLGCVNGHCTLTCAGPFQCPGPLHPCGGPLEIVTCPHYGDMQSYCSYGTTPK